MQAPCARGRGSLLQTQPLTGGTADAAWSQQSHARQCRRRAVQVITFANNAATIWSSTVCSEVQQPPLAMSASPRRTIWMQPQHPLLLVAPPPPSALFTRAEPPRGNQAAGQRSRGARAAQVLREHTPDAAETYPHHPRALTAIVSHITASVPSSKPCHFTAALLSVAAYLPGAPAP